MAPERKANWLTVAGTILAMAVSGAALGLTPKCSDYETKAAAAAAHDTLGTRINDTRVEVNVLWNELKAQREDIHKTQLQILEAVERRRR